MTINNKNPRRKKTFSSGVIVGAVATSLVTILSLFIQHRLSVSERQTQLIIDEKKEFISACNEYLKEYRNWHELMNYFVFHEDSVSFGVRDFQSDSEALLSYIKWKKDFDYAYGKVYLYSNSEFGHSTMLTSTVVHFSIKALIDYDLEPEMKQSILYYGDRYFFEKWLGPVKKEIFDYNKGRLKFENFDDYSRASLENIRISHSTDTTYNDLFYILNKLYPSEIVFQ